MTVGLTHLLGSGLQPRAPTNLLCKASMHCSLRKSTE